MEVEGTPPWWRRWLWLNLMLAAAVAVVYLLSISFDELGEWWNADGYFERRRERRDMIFPFVLAAIEAVLLLTVYRSGRREASKAAGVVAGMLAVVIGLTFVLDAIPTGLYGNDNSDSIGAVEGWLIAYLLGSHLAFALSARRAVPT